MADIVKKVNRIIPTLERSLTIDQTEVSGGDVVMVESSLGRSAKKVFIETDDVMTFRVNVYHDVFPLRDGRDLMTTAHLPNLALGGRIKDDTVALHELEANETYELDGSFPVSDIEIVTLSGNFTMTIT